MDLDGATVVVTGASAGIGRASAEAFARLGAHLVLVARDADRLQGVAGSVGGEPVVCDLADPAAVDRLGVRLTAAGAPDVVVHNAGVGLAAPAAETTEADLTRVFSVNVFAGLRLTRAVVPAMTARGSGRLVFVTSIAGRLGVATESVYAATKAALTAYAESLRLELAGTGVGVTTVVPGVVDTEFFARRGSPYARSFPRPVPPARVASALVRSVSAERDEVIVPAWFRMPITLHDLAPGLYSRLAARWS